MFSPDLSLYTPPRRLYTPPEYMYAARPLYSQDTPLDLSLKGEQGEGLDLDEFYRTYYLVSLRHYADYINSFQRLQIHEHQGPVTNNGRNTDSRLNTDIKKTKKRRMDAEGTESSPSSPKLKRRKVGTKVSGTSVQCNCRFCYEDHIIRMRQKLQKI